MPLDPQKSRQLLADGYCVFEGILDPPMLEELIRVTEGMLSEYPGADARRFRYQGSNISVAYQHPVWPRLVAWPKALAALSALGFREPKWWSTFVLSKPPHAPPLYWHQDWWAWGDPCSAGEAPPQVFLMYYLTDTSVENGCLRVIPGTHRRRIALHDLLPAAHSEETYQAGLDAPLFCRHPDEVEVPVKAGDVVIGDARLLHAAHANQTDERRTCLTLWYFPAYASLPEPVRAFITKGRSGPPPDYAWLEPLIPRYTGMAEPVVWDRNPGVHLGRHSAARPSGGGMEKQSIRNPGRQESRRVEK